MIRKILAAGLMCAGTAMGQTATATAAATGAAAPAKSYAFDVVSIRRNISTQMSALPQFGPTPDGYRMIDMSMGTVIMTAFVPQVAGASFFGPNNVKGYPDWFNTERYDIDARISDEDRAAWQDPVEQKVMLRAMLQAMLADRCKLAVHREVKEVTVYSLVVAKGGVKFKPTDPAVQHTDGIKLPWGGVLVPTKDGTNLYGSSMASLASLLSTMGGNVGRAIQDKTGLTGRYDFVLKRPEQIAPSEAQQGGPTASDPGGSMVYSMVNDLGLKLESAKGQVETLVIDHMERPSPN